MSKDKDLWISRSIAAAALSMSTNNLDQRIRPRLDKKSVKGSGKTLRLFLPAVVAAYMTQQQELQPTDPLLAGGDSPALERYRAARAEMSEIELARIKGELIPAKEVERGGTAVVTMVRNQFLQLPFKMAIAVEGMSLQEREVALDEEVRNILEHLSKGFEDLAKNVAEADRQTQGNNK